MKKVYNVWHGTANGGLYLKGTFATRKEADAFSALDAGYYVTEKRIDRIECNNIRLGYKMSVVLEGFHLRAYNSGGCVTEDKAEPNKVIEDKVYDNTFNVCVIATSQKDAKRLAKELVMEHICSKEN